jgi:hypothetical protein
MACETKRERGNPVTIAEVKRFERPLIAIVDGADEIKIASRIVFAQARSG